MASKKDEEYFLKLYNEMRLRNIQQFLENALYENNIEEQLNLDLFNEEKDISGLTTEDVSNRNSSREVKENKKIQSIIYSLSEENFSDDKYTTIKCIVDDLYKDKNYRYDYYEIYAYISEIAENEPLKLNFLTANTEEFKNRLQEELKDKRIDKKYSKLIQYIKLESMRSYADIEKRKEINDANEQVKQELETTKQQLDTAKNKLRKQQFDMLAVLGVFSAIILAFTGGLNFSSSVLENMNNASIYRVLIISILLGFTLVNGIAILLKYIKSINVDENEEMDRIEKVGFWKYIRDRYVVSYIAKFNTIALILLVVVVLSCLNDWLHFENSLNEKLRAIESANSTVLNTVIQEEKNKDKSEEQDNKAKVKKQSNKDENVKKKTKSKENKNKE